MWGIPVPFIYIHIWTYASKYIYGYNEMFANLV